MVLVKITSSKVSFCSLLLVLAGCLGDVNRDNPLDPKSPNFENTGIITGETLSFFPPFQAVPDAEITLLPGAFGTRSDSEGRFTFTNIEPGIYQVSAIKDGFALANDTLNVTLRQTAFIRFNLDALPVIDSLAIFSCRINKLFPQPSQQFLQIFVKADDPDGVNDVTSVVLDLPELGFTDTLDIGQSFGDFQKIIPEGSLPISNLQQLVGRRLLVRLFDTAGFFTESQPQFLHRVITQQVQAEAPKDLIQLNDPNPVLVWSGTDLPFAFSFRAEVVRFEFGLETVFWTSPLISNERTSVRVEPALPQGSYFWTVAIVDEFGNWSRSIEATFRIN